MHPWINRNLLVLLVCATGLCAHGAALCQSLAPLRNQDPPDSILSGAEAPAWNARKIVATGAVGGIFLGSLIG
ncbi:MAG TPA: hypothetical protein VLT13_12285, partial [Bacteroidota bacterium]|nr:hypothetical protein [Bacteroidota bacterium]